MPTAFSLTQYTTVSSTFFSASWLSNCLLVAMVVFALGWIVLWFSGGPRSKEEDVKQRPTPFNPGAKIMLTQGGQTPRIPGETPPTHLVRSNMEATVLLGT